MSSSLPMLCVGLLSVILAGTHAATFRPIKWSQKQKQMTQSFERNRYHSSRAPATGGRSTSPTIFQTLFEEGSGLGQIDPETIKMFTMNFKEVNKRRESWSHQDTRIPAVGAQGAKPTYDNPQYLGNPKSDDSHRCQPKRNPDGSLFKVKMPPPPSNGNSRYPGSFERNKALTGNQDGSFKSDEHRCRPKLNEDGSYYTLPKESFLGMNGKLQHGNLESGPIERKPTFASQELVFTNFANKSPEEILASLRSGNKKQDSNDVNSLFGEIENGRGKSEQRTLDNFQSFKDSSPADSFARFSDASYDRKPASMPSRPTYRFGTFRPSRQNTGEKMGSVIPSGPVSIINTGFDSINPDSFPMSRQETREFPAMKRPNQLRRNPSQLSRKPSLSVAELKATKTRKGTAPLPVIDSGSLQTPSGAGERLEDVVLEYHNRYRKKHGSPALTYNYTLQAVAQSWANECAKRKDIPHQDPNPYGENLWMGTSHSVDDNDQTMETESKVDPIQAIKHAIDSFYGEIKDYEQYFDFDEEPDKKTLHKWGHFTQLVWTETKQVGMAFSKLGSVIVVAAEYYPPGNIRNYYKINVPKPKY